MIRLSGMAEKSCRDFGDQCDSGSMRGVMFVLRYLFCLDHYPYQFDSAPDRPGFTLDAII